MSEDFRRPRRVCALPIEYKRWPALEDTGRLAALRDLVADIVDYSHEDYDTDKWPAWREWAASTAATTAPPSRQTAIWRLELLGIL